MHILKIMAAESKRECVSSSSGHVVRDRQSQLLTHHVTKTFFGGIKIFQFRTRTVVFAKNGTESEMKIKKAIPRMSV